MQFGWELSAKKDNSDTLFKDHEPQKNPTLTRGTYLHSPYTEVPGPRPRPPARGKC